MPAKTFKILTSKVFDKAFMNLVRKNITLKSKVIKVFKTISADPFHPSLRTHKVQTRSYGLGYSSRVTGDLRIIWNFTPNELVIIALTIGSHTGRKKVYN